MVRNVLGLVDFSKATDKIVSKAGEVARLYKAKCWLVHVATPDPELVGYDLGPRYIRDARADVLKEEHRRMLHYKELTEAQGVECEALLIQGDVTDMIDERVAKLNIDLIVLGSHGRSMIYEMLVGSVCEHLLKRSAVPLLVVPARSQE